MDADVTQVLAFLERVFTKWPEVGRMLASDQVKEGLRVIYSANGLMARVFDSNNSATAAERLAMIRQAHSFVNSHLTRRAALLKHASCGGTPQRQPILCRRLTGSPKQSRPTDTRSGKNCSTAPLLHCFIATLDSSEESAGLAALHWLDCLNYPDTKHIVERFIEHARDITPAVAEFAEQFMGQPE
jgi:hypothetical protein